MAQSINVATALGGLFDQIRNSGSASYLSGFGLKDAVVRVGDNPGENEWRVLQASIELGHASTLSRIHGEASIDSGGTPWKISFSAEQKPNRIAVHHGGGPRRGASHDRRPASRPRRPQGLGHACRSGKPL